MLDRLRLHSVQIKQGSQVPQGSTGLQATKRLTPTETTRRPSHTLGFHASSGWCGHVRRLINGERHALVAKGGRFLSDRLYGREGREHGGDVPIADGLIREFERAALSHLFRRAKKGSKGGTRKRAAHADALDANH